MKNENLEAKIFTPTKEGDKFYVYIYDKIAQKPIQKFYKGINRFNTKEECYEFALDVQKAYEIKLKTGWIPNIGRSFIEPINIKEAFLRAIISLEGKVSKNTFIAYSCTTRFFIDAIESLNYSKLPSDKFSRSYAKKCLEWIVESRKWSNHAYNKNLGYIRSVFSEIIEQEHAEINPFREIKNLKIVKTPANIPPSDEEMQIICDQLKKENYGLYILYMIEYHCGIRPAEQVELKISQLDFKNKLILLKAEETKSKKFRKVPMLGNVYDLLLPFKDLDSDYYIFGTPSRVGGWNSRKGWFTPNPHKIRVDSPTKEWNRIVKQGLKMDFNLYSGKHKGADDKRAAGIPIKTICKIFGHSETRMTERYMHSLALEEFEQARKIKSKTF